MDEAVILAQALTAPVRRVLWGKMAGRAGRAV